MYEKTKFYVMRPLKHFKYPFKAGICETNFSMENKSFYVTRIIFVHIYTFLFCTCMYHVLENYIMFYDPTNLCVLILLFFFFACC